MKRIFAAWIAVLLLILPVFAAGTYIMDEAGLLTDASALEREAAALTETYQCGVYFAAIEDFRDYGTTVEDAAENFYLRRGLGWGEESSGILLFLSMDDRDYDILAYGYGNLAFTDYGKLLLEEYFLDDFAENDWESGIADYLRGCDDFLWSAANGEPIDREVDDYGNDWDYEDDYGKDYETGYDFSFAQVILLLVLVPCGLSLGVCMILKSRLNSVRRAENAAVYAAGKIQLSTNAEIYLNTTHTRTRVASSNSGGSRHGGSHHSGGTHTSSRGFSHRSGKF